MANFGSRDQFCIKKDFGLLKGRDLMEACSKSVKASLKEKTKTKRKLEIEDEEETPGENEKYNKKKTLAC